MKRFIVMVLAGAMLLTLLSGCGIKQKLEEKAGEEIGEKLLEKIAGDEVDIELNDDGFAIEGTDGAKVNFGGGDWPDSDLAKLIPKYDSGEITSVMDSEDFIQIVINESDTAYFNNYLAKIKENFKNDTFESESEDSMSYTATDDSGNTVVVFFQNNECVISLQAGET